MLYRLTRDDGAQHRLNGSLWEAALELAYLYGWRPAGTDPPRSSAPQACRPTARTSGRLDYFSLQSQHVRQDDARRLAEALMRSLESIPDSPSIPGGPRRFPVAAASLSVVPSRASAVAEGLSAARKQALRNLARFAACAGFSIDGTL
jgi:hypothetical protein